MEIDKQTVEKVARLARLALSQDEVKKYQGELSQTLAYVEKLKELDTSDVAPTAQVTGVTNALADDVVSNKPESDKLLNDVPNTDGTSIKVKAVFDD